MLPRSPGPSSTTSGAPVSMTTSPGLMPLVSSYTWMIVLSPMIWMTSPRSCSSPTNWTSYMRGRSPVAVTTGPATRKISPVPFPATPLSVRFIAMVRAPSSNHLYRSTPIARLIFSRKSSSSRFPTAITTGRGVVSRRCRKPWLRASMSSALRIRIPTFASSRTFATCHSNLSRPTLKVLRTPASLNPWTNSSRPTAASSISDHQEISDDVRGQAALLPPGDDPQVLDLAVLSDDVIQDHEDGERVHMGVPPRLQEMELLDRSDELPDAEGLEVLQLCRKVFGERVVAKPGREAVDVQGHHLGKLRPADLEASLDERLVRQGGLRRPESQKGFQIHDVDLAANEFPHQSGPFRPLRDHGEEVLVIQFRDEVFPLVPALHLGRFLAEGLQRLSMDRPFEPVEHLVQGRQVDEALEEGFAHAPGGDDVLQDLRRRRAEHLPTDDCLNILHVESVQVPTDHLTELALRKLDDLRVDGGEVPTRGEFDQVDSGRLRRERQDLGLVGALAQHAGDLGDFHLEHPFVDVQGEECRLLRPHACGDVWIVPALDRDPAGHAPPVPSEFGRESGGHGGGHRTSATSLIESRQTSARMVSNRRSIRRDPSALSITTPPTHSIVPPKFLPTIDRTAFASRALQYTFPFRHSSSCARRRDWTRPSLSARRESLSRTAAYTW